MKRIAANNMKCNINICNENILLKTNSDGNELTITKTNLNVFFMKKLSVTCPPDLSVTIPKDVLTNEFPDIQQDGDNLIIDGMGVLTTPSDDFPEIPDMEFIGSTIVHASDLLHNIKRSLLMKPKSAERRQHMCNVEWTFEDTKLQMFSTNGMAAVRTQMTTQADMPKKIRVCLVKEDLKTMIKFMPKKGFVGISVADLGILFVMDNKESMFVCRAEDHEMPDLSSIEEEDYPIEIRLGKSDIDKLKRIKPLIDDDFKGFRIRTFEDHITVSAVHPNKGELSIDLGSQENIDGEIFLDYKPIMTILKFEKTAVLKFKDGNHAIQINNSIYHMSMMDK